jgi:steroid 5-alpha reductase family enzyme
METDPRYQEIDQNVRKILQQHLQDGVLVHSFQALVRHLVSYAHTQFQLGKQTMIPPLERE